MTAVMGCRCKEKKGYAEADAANAERASRRAEREAQVRAARAALANGARVDIIRRR